MELLAEPLLQTRESDPVLISVVILGMLVGVGGGIASFLYGLLSRGATREAKLRIPLEEKLGEVLDLSTRLAVLNKEVQAEFDLQLAATKKAQQDATDAAAIASQNEEQRQAMEALVSAQMDEVLKRTGKSDRRFQLVVASVSFALGILVSLGTTWITQLITG